MLVEKGELTSGSTWHAAGQCPHFNGSLNLTKVHVYGTELYPKLEALTGVAVSLARLRRLAARDERRGGRLVQICPWPLEARRLRGADHRPQRDQTYHPFLETFGVKAAYRHLHRRPCGAGRHHQCDGGRARASWGAEIYRRTRVTDIRRLPTGEWQVVTDSGNIRCEHVVNSAGSYCRIVAHGRGTVPIANILHHYMITEPLQELIDLSGAAGACAIPGRMLYARGDQRHTGRAL